MSQLFFSFQTGSKTDLYKEEDFLTLQENAAAINFLQKFFTQESFITSQFPSLIIKGQTASGKSHLLHNFSKKFHLDFLNKDKISDLNLSSFFIGDKFYILEDINEIKDEELLLRLINSAAESHAFLVLSSKENLPFQLRDLVSRLKNIFAVEIKAPGHETIEQLLVKGFSSRQINLSGRYIEYIADNIERSYEAISSAIKRVEFFCQENGKNISMKELNKIFGKW